MSAPTHAMILAAGLGLRMRPLTQSTPKPLIEVAGRALIDHALAFVRDGGIAHAAVNKSYLADQLEAHLKKHRGAPEVTLSHEDSPLETGGGILRALPHLGAAPFLSLNSDSITLGAGAHPARRLSDAWNGQAMDALLLLHPRETARGYEGKGDFFLNGDGSVRRRGEAAAAAYIFTGVQLLHPRIFDGAPAGAFSLNVLYNRGLQPDGTCPRIHALVHDGEWLHVGDPAGLKAAEQVFKKIL